MRGAEGQSDALSGSVSRAVLQGDGQGLSGTDQSVVTDVAAVAGGGDVGGGSGVEGEDEGVAGVELGEEAGQEVLLLLHLEHAILQHEGPQLLHRAGRHIVRDAGGEMEVSRRQRLMSVWQRRLFTKAFSPILEKGEGCLMQSLVSL